LRLQKKFWGNSEKAAKRAQKGIDFIVGSCHDRCLSSQTGHLREALKEAPLLGQTTVELRARGSQQARTAVVELRSLSVGLEGP
jgi:hypothetical protein